MARDHDSQFAASTQDSIYSDPAVRAAIRDHIAEQESSGDPRPVRTCGICKRTGTVGFHPKPHHIDSRTGEEVFICVSERRCRGRWVRGLRG